MANPAPVLRVSGTVHSVRERTVPPVDATEDVRDEHGALMRRGREAREGYDVHDVTILTVGGGFVTAVFREEAIRDAGGYLPGPGDTVEGLPVFSYVAWAGPEGRRFATAAISFAGSVYAEEHSRTSAGRRSVEPVSASA
jgi:hypothetical protein